MEKVFYFVLLILNVTGCTSNEEELRNKVIQLTDQGEFNGIIHINSFGEEAFNYSYSPNHSRLMTVDENTPVQLASLTKFFTELVLLRMSDENLIDLDKTIFDYRENFKPDFGQVITIRQLLEMKSGLPRELDSEKLTGVVYDSNLKSGPFLDEIENFELAFEPGSNVVYSNLNYWLIGAVIEEVSGMNVDEAFKKYLFNPLEMNSSGLHKHKVKTVSGYYKEAENWLEDKTNYQNRYTSGGFYSTVSDLNKAIKALKSGNFLTTNSKNYLLGEDQRVEVFGSLKGFSNMLVLDLKNEFSVIALNNVGLPDLDSMIQLLSQIDSIFGVENRSKSASGNKIQVEPIDSLSTGIKLEYVLAMWTNAVLEEDQEALFNILDSASIPGSFEQDDKTWNEIIQVKQTMQNLRVAGFRWVQNEFPKGLEVWFVSDTEAKIGFLLIPSEENPELLSNLMVKPVDIKWMGDQF